MPTDTLYDDARLYDLAHGALAEAPEVVFYRRLAGGGACLELGCGTGRVALPLARLGVPVTGLDASPVMLAAARENARRLEVAVDWVEGDFRDFDLGRRFDLVTIPCRAIAHLATHADFGRCLERVRAHMAPGGRFVIDYFVPDLALLARDPEARFPARVVHDEAGAVALTIEERNRYDPLSQLNAITWYYRFPDGRELERRFRMRVYFPEELMALLAHQGFTVEARYGDFIESPLAADSPAQLIVSRLTT